VKDRYIAVFKDKASADNAESAEKKLVNIRRKYTDGPIKALSFDLPAQASETAKKQALERVKKRAGVAFVYQDYKLQAVGLPGAWSGGGAPTPAACCAAGRHRLLAPVSPSGRQPERRPAPPHAVPIATGQVNPPGVRRIGAANATHVAPPADVAVAILDTGIDLAHPDLNVIDGINCVDSSLSAQVSEPRGPGGSAMPGWSPRPAVGVSQRPRLPSARR
jgi:hypothetical protein